MRRSIRLFHWSLAISFLGTLPLGTLNLSIANYAFRHDLSGVIEFSGASIFVEMTIVGLGLLAIRRLESLTHYFRYFNILTCGLLLFLACNSLLAAWQMEPFRPSAPLSFLSPWLSGFLLSLTNPLHLPFWLGWTAVLRSKNILDDKPHSHYTYITAIGLGTAAGFCVYALAGGYFIQLLGRRQNLLNWIVGIALLGTSIAQIYKTFAKRTTNEATFRIDKV